MFVAEHGDPARPALVLLHGGGAGGWTWRRQVRSLFRSLFREFHLLVPDLFTEVVRGHLAGARLPGELVPFDPESLAR